MELAKEVVALAESGKADFAPIYASELTLKEKSQLWRVRFTVPVM